MESITLDLIPNGIMPVLHASQYDINRSHHIDITEGGTPYKLDGTETLTINERKGDNCICTLDVENTFANKTYIEFSSTEQMCAVWGSNLCELRIIKGGVDLGTLNFIIEVEASPIEGGIQSASEINNLYTQIDARVDEDVEGKLDDYATKEWVGEECYDKTYMNGIFEQIDNAFTGVNNALGTKANTTDVNNALANKMDKSNPVGTGSFSLNRKEGSVVGLKSISMGSNTEATKNMSVATGFETKATANVSNASNYRTTASGAYSHAEGCMSVASNYSAHAEGNETIASGNCSHAQGNGTEAKGDTQSVLGKYNIVDDNNTYAEIVGNGVNNNNRSNARTLDWQGNETLAGDLVYNGNKSLTSEVQRLDDKIDALPEPMVFKGTLGVGGTITALPTASASNEGWTYKVITAGTYAGQYADIGDCFTCFEASENVFGWTISSKGDTDSDTWRAIKVNGVEKLGNGISSGAVDFRGSANIDVTFDADGNKVEIATKNIYTQTEVNNLVAQAIVDILPTETKSGSVANFETDLVLPYQLAKFGIAATQEAGTPTPSSPKAISGWSQIVATQADSNMSTVEQITIALGDTYYGGYVEVDKDGHRRLVVTHEIKHLKDLDVRYSNNTGAWASWLFFANVSDKKQGQPVKCSHYEVVTINNVGVLGNFKANAPAWSNYFYWRDDTYTSVDDFKNNAPDISILVNLATPIIINLPDGEPITALNGVNNVFCDSGDAEVTYKLSINKALSNLGGGNRSVNLSKSVEEEVKEEQKDEPETRQER